jgi:sugar phosphate isomerase/epimerase
MDSAVSRTDVQPTTTVRPSAIGVGLATSGSTYTWGLRPDSGRPRVTVREYMDYAASIGLSGVELPGRMLVDEDVEALGRHAAEQGLLVTIDTDGFDPTALAKVIDLAVRIGAPTVRTVVGGAKIGGDRRPLAGRWQPFLDEVHAKLTIAASIADDASVNLAVENHQDLASEELLWLCESIDSEHFGITLDSGNPLATAEEPIDYFRRVAPYVKNVHLKDYRTWHSDEGYLLVRCALGEGLVDFPALLDILDELAPQPSLAIELAALEARNIRVFADDFWPDYPARTAAQLAAALRVIETNTRTDGDWRTPFEKGSPVEAIVAYEEEQLEQSLSYIRTLQTNRAAEH